MKKAMAWVLVFSIVVSLGISYQVNAVNTDIQTVPQAGTEIASGQDYLLTDSEDATISDGQIWNIKKGEDGYSLRSKAKNAPIPTTYFTTANTTSPWVPLEDTEEGLQITGTSFANQYAKYSYDTPIPREDIDTITFRYKVEGQNGWKHACVYFCNEDTSDSEGTYVSLLGAESNGDYLEQYVDNDGFVIITLDFKKITADWSQDSNLSSILLSSNDQNHVVTYDYVAFNLFDVADIKVEFTSENVTAPGNLTITDEDNALNITGAAFHYATHTFKQAIPGKDIDTIKLRYKVANQNGYQNACIRLLSNSYSLYVNLDGITDYAQRTVDKDGYTVIVLDFQNLPMTDDSTWPVGSRKYLDLTGISLGGNTNDGIFVYDYIEINGEIEELATANFTKENTVNKGTITKSNEDNALQVSGGSWFSSGAWYTFGEALERANIGTLTFRFKGDTAVVYLQNDTLSDYQEGVYVDLNSTDALQRFKDGEGYTIATFDFQTLTSSWTKDSKFTKILLSASNINGINSYDYVSFNVDYKSIPRTLSVENTTSVGSASVTPEDGGIKVTNGNWRHAGAKYILEQAIAFSEINTLTVRYKTVVASPAVYLNTEESGYTSFDTSSESCIDSCVDEDGYTVAVFDFEKLLGNNYSETGTLSNILFGTSVAASNVIYDYFMINGNIDFDALSKYKVELKASDITKRNDTCIIEDVENSGMRVSNGSWRNKGAIYTFKHLVKYSDIKYLTVRYKVESGSPAVYFNDAEAGYSNLATNSTKCIYSEVDVDGFTIATFDFVKLLGETGTLSSILFGTANASDSVIYDYVLFDKADAMDMVLQQEIELKVAKMSQKGTCTIEDVENSGMRVSGGSWINRGALYTFQSSIKYSDIEYFTIRYKVETGGPAVYFNNSNDNYTSLKTSSASCVYADVDADGFTIATFDFKKLLGDKYSDTGTLSSILFGTANLSDSVIYDYILFDKIECTYVTEFFKKDGINNPPSAFVLEDTVDGLSVSGASFNYGAKYYFEKTIPGSVIDTISFRYKPNSECSAVVALYSSIGENIYLNLDSTDTTVVTSVIDSEGYKISTVNFKNIGDENGFTWTKDKRSSQLLASVGLTTNIATQNIVYESFWINGGNVVDETYLNLDVFSETPTVSYGPYQELNIESKGENCITVSREISGTKYYATFVDGQLQATTEDSLIYLYDLEIVNSDVYHEMTDDTPYYIPGDKQNVVIDGDNYTSRFYDTLGVHNLKYNVGEYDYNRELILYKEGDCNLDGEINSIDLVRSLKYVQDSLTPNKAEKKSCDLISDDILTVDDTKLLRKRMIGSESVMAITGYAGPSMNMSSEAVMDTFLSDECMSMISDIGINNIVYTDMDYKAAKLPVKKYLDLGAKYDVGIFVTDSRISTDMADGTDVDTETLLSYLADYKDHPGFAGLYLVDEPSTDYFYNKSGNPRISNYKKIAPALEEQDIFYYANMYPGDNDGWLGNLYESNFERYVGEFCDTFNSGVIMWDRYVWDNDRVANYQDYFYCLDLMRNKAIEKNEQFWGYIQAGAQWVGGDWQGIESTKPYYPDEGQFNWNVNTTLAFGAKGIQYFPLIQPKQFSYTTTDGVYDFERNGLIGANGVKTQWYDYAKNINKHIVAIDDVLMDSEHKGIIVKSSTAENDLKWAKNVKRYTTYNELQSITGNAMVGCFDYNGKTALYVVNYDNENAGEVTLTFNGTYDIRKVQNVVNSHVNSNYIKLELAAGEGVLLVVD